MDETRVNLELPAKDRNRLISGFEKLFRKLDGLQGLCVTGGYLLVAHAPECSVQLLHGIGYFDPGRKAQDAREQVERNARRLASHPGHVSSAESASGYPAQAYLERETAGAIRTTHPGLILSISTLNGLLDEAVAVVLALGCDMINPLHEKQIRDLSGNVFIEEVHKLAAKRS